MEGFTFEGQNLMSIYNSTGTREGLMEALTEMRGYLDADETELMELTDSALEKLRRMDAAAFCTDRACAGIWRIRIPGRRFETICQQKHKSMHR